MNKIKFLASASIVAALLIGGCSNDKNEDVSPSVAPSSNTSKESKTADYWTVIDGGTWTDDFQGLKTTIKKIVVSDKVPMTDGSLGSAVGVKFNIENTTKETFNTFPDQALMVTSTGEQIKAELFESDEIGGEINEGVTKEGNVNFYLEQGHAEDIEWINLKWFVREGEEMGNGERKDYDIKIDF